MTRTRSEGGETLVELLITVSVLSVACVAVLAALTTTIGGSTKHRTIASADTVLKDYAETARYQIEMQPLPALFLDCPTPATGTGPFVLNYYQSHLAPWTLPSGSSLGRSVTDAVTNSTTKLTSATAAFSSADVGLNIIGANIAWSATITSVTNATTAVMSVAATTTASAVTATISGYSVRLTKVEPWNSVTKAFETTGACPTSGANADANGLQRVTISSTGPGGVANTLQIVVRDPTWTIAHAGF